MMRTAPRMRDTPGTPNFGTRWRVFPAIAAGFIALAIAQTLVSRGALAVNFTTSDQQFKIYSNYVEGTYGASYLGRNTGYSTQDGVMEFGFKAAKLAGLCAIAHQDLGLPGVGQVSFVITAGVPVRASFDNSSVVSGDGANNPVSLDSNGHLSGTSLSGAVGLTDMYINSTGLTGYGNKISGLDLGRDAATIAGAAGLTFSSSQGGTSPVSGKSGLLADNLNISGLNGDSYGINLAGNSALPGLKLKVALGYKSQDYCPEAAQG